jgi:hypothetical protein
MNPFAAGSGGSIDAAGSSSMMSDQPLQFSQPGGGDAQKPPQTKVMFFHLFFKGLALLTYLLATSLGAGYVLTFVLVVLFSAFDFWTGAPAQSLVLPLLVTHTHAKEALSYSLPTMDCR